MCGRTVIMRDRVCGRVIVSPVGGCVPGMAGLCLRTIMLYLFMFLFYSLTF